MKILAFDSSGLVASVAIVEDGSLIAEYTTNYKKTHSQTLLPMLDEVVRMTETDKGSFDALAVAAGPGSFTGLRIGSATVKGLAFAWNLPVIAVPTLEGLAYNLWGCRRLICPIMDARRRQVYTGLYTFDEADELVTVMEQTPMAMDELIDELNGRGESVVFVGDGIDVFAKTIEEKLGVPYSFAPAHMNKQRAGSVAAAAWVRYSRGQYCSGDDFAPEYLRLSQAERERAEKLAAGKEPEDSADEQMKIYKVTASVESAEALPKELTAEKLVGIITDLESEIFGSPWTRSMVAESVTYPYETLAVCICGGDLAGYIIYSAPGDTADLLRVAVKPEQRRRGIAKKLIDYMVSDCAGKGDDGIMLEVRTSNRAARALYDRAGFEQISVRKDYYKNPVEDAVVMRKNITA